MSYKDTLLGRLSLDVREVEVEGVGSIHIRPLTAALSQELFGNMKKLSDAAKNEKSYEFVRVSLVDPDTREPILSAEDVKRIPLDKFQAIAKAIRIENGLEDREGKAD